MAKCAFCPDQVVSDADDTYKQATVWLHGPKADGATLREYTGLFAHSECIAKVQAGYAPDQETLFE